MFDRKTSEIGGQRGGARRSTALTLTGLVAAFGIATASPALAEGFTEDVGSSERVNLSGQLGTISERITAAACNLSAGVAVVESQAVLKISTNHFSRINQALLVGNRGFGILGEEKRPRTLRAINDLNAKWEPLQEMANATQASANDNDYVESLYDQSNPVQDEAKILVSEITGQYADPAIMQHADALLIEIAGRQRMLANRMSKNVCLIASDVQDEKAMAELQETMGLFQTSLDALQNGLPSVGLRPPPTQGIANGLNDVAAEWDAINPYLDAFIGGAELSTEVRAQLFLAFLGMEARMNNVVHNYQKNSKQRL